MPVAQHMLQVRKSNSFTLCSTTFKNIQNWSWQLALALLFKKSWLEWGSCRSEAKVHPNEFSSISINLFNLRAVFIPFRIFHHKSHQFTISPHLGLGANSNLWLGHVQVQPTSLQEKVVGFSNKLTFSTFFHPSYLLESWGNNTSINAALHCYMTTWILQKVSSSLFSLLFIDGSSCSNSSCNLDRSSRWFFPRYTGPQDIFVLGLCLENMWESTNNPRLKKKHMENGVKILST